MADHLGVYLAGHSPLVICALWPGYRSWSKIDLADTMFAQLTALIIGSCVICIDPVLSQAIAKGPFADKYVRRHLREFISAEAGGNDGFGFPFLLLSIALLRYADVPQPSHGHTKRDWIGAMDVGRFGGDVGEALAHWAVEGVLYMIIMASGYGLFVGFVSRKGLHLALKR